MGDNRATNVNVRLVAATNQNLHQAIRERRFREDLFYRLNIISIELPPLRARRGDVEPLARHFLRRYAAKLGLDVVEDTVVSEKSEQRRQAGQYAS